MNNGEKLGSSESPWKKQGAEDRAVEGADRQSSFAEKVLGSIEKAKLMRFRSALVDAGGTYRETFAVAPDGYVRVPQEDPDGPDLILCSPSENVVRREGDVEVTMLRYKSEDLRKGARHITDTHPDITFEFQESPTRDKITYTAMLKKPV